MKKSDAITLAARIVERLIDSGKLNLDLDVNASPKKILTITEAIAKGLIEIEKKL